MLSFTRPEQVDQPGEWAAPTPGLIPSVQALAALRRAGAAEVRFSPLLGWAAGLESRQGGLEGVRIVIELQPGDELLARDPEPGQPYTAWLERAAARCALRDADAVEGDPKALQALRDAGVPMALPRAAPRWTTRPSVSAIVTHMNLEKYLPECLASLRAQTVPVEIVVLDDGSAAPGLAVLAEEERRDPSLRVIRQENTGICGARNRAVREARGEYVLIVDADNVMRPRLVERLLEAIRCRPGASYAVSALRAFEDGSGALHHLYCPMELTAAPLLVENTGGDACALHHRQTLLDAGGFKEGLYAVEDWDLWVRYAEEGRAGAVVPEVLFDYRMRGNSMIHGRSTLQQVATPFRMAMRHVGLLAKQGEAVAWLWAARKQEQLEEAGRVGAHHQAVAERAIQAQLRVQLAEAEQRTTAAQQQAAGAQREAEAARAAAATAQAEAEEAEARARRALSLAEAAERIATAHAATSGQARQEAANLRAEVSEMSSSSAVRLARMLQRVSPSAHKLVGLAARTVLRKR